LRIDEVEKAVGTIHFQIRIFSPGNTVAISGEEVTKLMIVVSGTVRVRWSILPGK